MLKEWTSFIDFDNIIVSTPRFREHLLPELSKQEPTPNFYLSKTLYSVSKLTHRQTSLRAILGEETLAKTPQRLVLPSSLAGLWLVQCGSEHDFTAHGLSEGAQQISTVSHRGLSAFMMMAEPDVVQISRKIKAAIWRLCSRKMVSNVYGASGTDIGLVYKNHVPHDGARTC